MKATNLLAIVCLSFLTLGAPVQAHAATWDFLFTDLSWPEETSPVSGTSQGGSIGNFVTSGIVEGTSTSSSGFWDFLFTDLKWPDTTSSAIGGL